MVKKSEHLILIPAENKNVCTLEKILHDHYHDHGGTFLRSIPSRFYWDQEVQVLWSLFTFGDQCNFFFSRVISIDRDLIFSSMAELIFINQVL